MGLLGKIAAIGATATAGIITAKALQNNKANNEEKNKFINATRDYKDYRGNDVLGVAKELLGAGFKNIELKPIKKLNVLSAKKYGKIDNITIGGNSNFSKNNKFQPFSSIVISYFDFNEYVDPCIYETVTRIEPGNWNITKNEHATISLESAPHQNNVYTAKKFCPFCGVQSQNEEAKFCFSCGKSI